MDGILIDFTADCLKIPVPGPILDNPEINTILLSPKAPLNAESPDNKNIIISQQYYNLYQNK